MIDGIKINCIGTTPENWERNPLLKFVSKVDTTTGEVLAKNKVAFYFGLSFHIVPSTVTDEKHCFVRGSLATFYNKGINNAFDFDLQMISEAIQELQTRFDIDPTKAKIQTFEFGANINPKQPIKQILNGFRAYQSDNFTGLKMDNVFNGKQLQRYEYAVKIYDKGLQTAKPQSNLIRIEYSIKKSRLANKYGFTFLIDLTNKGKLERLKSLLLDVWQNIVFYDRGMKWRYMNDTQTKKILFYLDATNWPKFTKMQRSRAKQHFDHLISLFCVSTTQTDIADLLAQKMDKLTAVSCYHFTNFLKENNSQKEGVQMLPFHPLDKAGNGNTKPHKKSIKPPKQKKVENFTKTTNKKCCSCGADISHKKTKAVYCSKRCNNITHARKRKQYRQNLKKVENDSLALLLAKLHKSNLPLLIEYKTSTGTFGDQLEQKEIATSPEWIKRVFKVTINTPPAPVVLTSYRSRKLIKQINNLNFEP